MSSEAVLRWFEIEKRSVDEQTPNIDAVPTSVLWEFTASELERERDYYTDLFNIEHDKPRANGILVTGLSRKADQFIGEIVRRRCNWEREPKDTWMDGRGYVLPDFCFPLEKDYVMNRCREIINANVSGGVNWAYNKTTLTLNNARGECLASITDYNSKFSVDLFHHEISDGRAFTGKATFTASTRLRNKDAPEYLDAVVNYDIVTFAYKGKTDTSTDGILPVIQAFVEHQMKFDWETLCDADV